MATVLRESGFNCRIYSDDHEPPHVHVVKAGVEVVIDLGDDDTSPSIRETKGMRVADVNKAIRIVTDNQQYLREKWSEIHG
jgi:hypothetical protein